MTLLGFFNYSHLLLVQTNKENHHTLLLYSFIVNAPYSNFNSKDLTWCLNISSLLECNCILNIGRSYFLLKAGDAIQTPTEL